jgi:hypothetical protein
MPKSTAAPYSGKGCHSAASTPASAGTVTYLLADSMQDITPAFLGGMTGKIF